MRTRAVTLLLLCGPLAFAAVEGFGRFIEPIGRNQEVFAACLILVAVTAGVGLLFRSELCGYLAALTGGVFLIGCLLLYGGAVFDFWRPLPLAEYVTDDTPHLIFLERIAWLALSWCALACASCWLAQLISSCGTQITETTTKP